jgi:hypothetical protein
VRGWTSEEKAELTGQANDAERGERGVRGNGSTTGGPGPRDRERGSAQAKETGADRSAPAGREQESECARKTDTDRRGPPVRGGRRARGTGPGGLVWAEMAFSFFLDFLIPFLFLFSRVLNSKFKLGLKFK